MRSFTVDARGCGNPDGEVISDKEESGQRIASTELGTASRESEKHAREKEEQGKHESRGKLDVCLVRSSAPVAVAGNSICT